MTGWSQNDAQLLVIDVPAARTELYWLLGTSVRKIRGFLRTDVPSSQYKSPHCWYKAFYGRDIFLDEYL